jgi:hypothetical protein
LRSSLVIGSRCWLTGLTRRKSSTRCSSGPAPVTIVFQISGDSAGWIVLSVPLDPSATSFRSVGMMPRATY